ncbi:MAG: Gfo/Idh/MocA family oxidoreductase [Planctomycetes bacterium]|nr:Gfo/Idh/MocA family oxidoreductase [Planctomycetota bacterium]
MSERNWTRREVLKAAGAVLALPCFLPREALGLGGRPGANEQVKVCVIGLGGRANGVVADCRQLSAMRIVGVADCFKPRVGSFIKQQDVEKKWKGYEDFRKMIEEQKPDGVLIETTTHARAWITIIAMQMGCDVYIEKPMSLSIAEGRHMVAAARKYDRVTQVGTQQRSTPMNNWASDLVKSGAIGKVHTVLAPNFVGPKKWTGQPAAPMPEGASDGWWEIWTNQAELRPYHPQLHYGWAMWDDYDGGGECFGVSGWGTHSYDQVNRGLGTDETGPVSILLEEEVKVSNTGKFVTARGKEDTGADYHAMAKQVVGPRAKMIMTFASGVEMKCHLDGDVGPGLGAIFIGDKGSIEINRNSISSDPPEIITGAGSPVPAAMRGTPLHVQNWLECIQSRETCTADIEYGQRSSTLCYLVNIVREVAKAGETLHWDPKKERFTDSEAGNKLLARERRKGWELPALA